MLPMCLYWDSRELSSVLSFFHSINSLQNNKIVDWSNLKAFADDKTYLSENLKFILGRVENILGKGENACNQHFFLFPLCFQKAPSGSLKVKICLVKSYFFTKHNFELLRNEMHKKINKGNPNDQISS